MRRRMAVAATALAAMCGLVMPGTARAAGASVAGDWNLAYQAGAQGYFSSIAAISKNDSWAVAGLFRGNSTVYQPFIRHFDGKGWRVVTIPGARNFATDWVTASWPRNVWVLGATASGNYLTAAYRYDGARWHKVPVPAQTYLEDPVALGPANVWALGSDQFDNADVFHWNGTGWHGYTLNILPESLSASAWNNVWVGGTTLSAPGAAEKATAYRWNGSRWLPAAMPHPVAIDSSGLTVTSRSDVWIGWDTATATSAMHWNGHYWHVVTAPDSIPSNSANIVPDSRGGAWFGPFARWTGHAWIGPVNVAPDSSGGGFGPVVRVPGTSSFWLAAGVTNLGSSIQEPTIYRYDLT